MRKLTAALVCALAAFAAAKSSKCYTMGSNLIDRLSGCYLEKSSKDFMDYTCDNGFALIDKPTGRMTLIIEDARGKLTMGVAHDGCWAELLDEYGVAVIPAGMFPKGDNGEGLYLLFKKKFLSSRADAVADPPCPSSWQDSRGKCDARYFQ